MASMLQSSSDLKIPITVVGGGPVGMALAIELGRRGTDQFVTWASENEPPDAAEILSKAVGHTERGTGSAS